GSAELDRRVQRDAVIGDQAELTYTRIVNVQTYMSGLDAHDQLRLQRQVLVSCTYIVHPKPYCV
ncbi:hypothetical protein PHMEG_0008785, partial [Phytophthora megakarya]